MNIGYLDFSDDTEMFEKIKYSNNNIFNVELTSDKKLFPNLIFDEENYYVWLIW